MPYKNLNISCKLLEDYYENIYSDIQVLHIETLEFRIYLDPFSCYSYNEVLCYLFLSQAQRKYDMLS